MGFNELFSNLDASSPLFPNRLARVITIPKSATLSSALKKMIEHHIMSLVVVDPQTEVACCSITVLDVMHRLLHAYEAHDISKDDMFSMFDNKHELAHTKIVDIQEIAELDPAFSVPPTASLLQVIDIMVTHGAHRVLVTNEEGRVVNLITQSRIIDILSCVLDSVPECTRSVGELSNLIVKNPVTIHESKPAYEAFQLMRDKKISGLGVVNDDGKLVGCISADDIKHLGYDIRYFEMLKTSVSQYLESVRYAMRGQVGEEEAEDIIQREPVIACKVNTTLGQVVKMVSFYDIHRIFVTDESNTPQGIIALRDILHSLYKSRR